jgi:hypothetical protein
VFSFVVASIERKSGSTRRVHVGGGTWVYPRVKKNGPEVQRLKQTGKRVGSRVKAITAYGGECVCCGETRLMFLQLDHIHNDGKAHREQVSDTTRDLEKRGWPEDVVQVLCANCHAAKTHLGRCPCQKEKPAGVVARRDVSAKLYIGG